MRRKLRGGVRLYQSGPRRPGYQRRHAGHRRVMHRRSTGQLPGRSERSSYGCSSAPPGHGYQKYGANVRVGSISAFWTKGQGQGLCFKKSASRWLNIYSVWTNYQDREGRLFPERRNAAFVQNHFRFGDRVRVYLHEDFGDFRGHFMGGVSYMLFPSDKENTLSVFYDSAKEWQVRLTFSFNQMFSKS